MKKEIKVGFIGISGRGSGMLGLLLQIEGVKVPAVCDLVPERAQRGIDIVESAPECNYPVHSYLDYKELLEREKLDAVVICTTWISHLKIAIDAMRKGLYAAVEVGGAASVDECWQLVRTAQQKDTHCMLLENCCYDRNEMALFNMIKKGMFGELVHMEGGYRHDLRDEIVLGRENIHGRLYNFINRNGELYPTHQLGPIAKALNINRGNRFLTVNAVASKSRGLKQWIKDNKGEEYDLFNTDFACGDVVTTLIKCAHGETIQLNHDCCVPRPYSRDYMIQGTRGTYMETFEGESGVIYLEGLAQKKHRWDDFKPWREEYEHPLWKEYTTEGVKAGHGGMDYLVLSAFVESVKLRQVTPIDTYDTAAWMVVTCLSEQSAAMGGAPVPVPDFTDGYWIDREPYRRGKYCVDEVCEDYFK
ncbi:MAG: Alpha-N-acetylgalactosaminidase [Firmicutes bacterium ADurb.Bin300]|nr:MAG: Alpha-N-acetylgalactosaminidase [Firmicutes bacterium ADurb.Bin300]